MQQTRWDVDLHCLLTDELDEREFVVHRNG
jgi:hypothetical protein